MCHLASPVGQCDLDLVPVLQEPLDLASLRVEVALRDLRPVLHLLDGDVACLAPGFLGLLRSLVLVLAVVHDPADRRVGLRRDLDQVEVCLTGDRQGLRQRFDADLLAIRTDQPHLTGADAVVDPGFVVRRRSYRRSLLIDAQNLRTHVCWTFTTSHPGRKTTTRTPGKPTSASGLDRCDRPTRAHGARADEPVAGWGPAREPRFP